MDDLRALTLKPWWGYGVTHLGKRIENRSKPPPRILEDGRRFCVHAGKMPHQKDLRGRAEMGMDLSWMIERGLLVGTPELHSRSSAIIATARIDDVVTESDDPWFIGPFGWRLAEVFVLPEPVWCRGALGLWRVPPVWCRGALGLWRVPPLSRSQVLEQDPRATGASP